MIMIGFEFTRLRVSPSPFEVKYHLVITVGQLTTPAALPRKIMSNPSTRPPRTNLPFVSQSPATLLRTYLQKFTALTNGPFNVAISGGSLPLTLASALKDSHIDVSSWRVYFADERLVPTSHDDSNEKTWWDACKKIGYSGISKEQVKGIDDALVGDPKGSAEDYAAKIGTGVTRKNSSGIPSFDLILLGMGPDGHTCSLFPDHPLLDIRVGESTQTVAYITDSPKPPPTRITFTLPLLNAAKRLLFVVTGEAKAEKITSIFTDDNCKLPCRLVQDLPGPELIRWIVDDAAYSSLKKHPSSENGEYGTLGPASSLPFHSIWPAMVEKIQHPYKYLPVTDVSSSVRTGTDKKPAHVYREMKLIPTGEVSHEEIFADERNGRIDFISVAGDDRTVVNKYWAETGEVEYWQESTESRKRTRWQGVVNSTVLHAIEMTETRAVEMAK
jgi:6-phosphogluconolactonase